MINDPHMTRGGDERPYFSENGAAEGDRQAAPQITFSDLLLLVRRHWRGAMLVGLAVGLIGTGILAYSRPSFTSSAAVLFERGPGPGGGEGGALSAMLPGLGLGGEAGIETQKDLLRSFALAREVVTRLGLNTELAGPPHLLPGELTYWEWRMSGRAVEQFTNGLAVRDVQAEHLVRERVFELTFIDDRRYTVGHPGQGQDPLAEAVLGEAVAVDQVGWTLELLGEGVTIEPGTTLTLRVEPTQKAIEEFRKQLRLEGGMQARGQSSDVLRLSYASGSPYIAQAVVTHLSDLFIEQKHEWATSVPRAMQEFIGEQLMEMREQVDESTERLAEHQRETGMVKLEPQLEADLQRLVEAETRLRQSEMRLAHLRKLRDGLESSESPEPTLFAHLDEPVLERQGERLGELNSRIAGLEAEFRDSYPPLKLARAQREALLEDLRGTVERYYQRGEEHYEERQKVVEEYQERFAELPASARSLAEVMRTAKLHEEMYLYLLREQQKARLAEASTLSTVRLVDPAVLPLEETAPRARWVLVLIVAAAGGLSGGYLLWQGVRMREFVTSDEVRDAVRFPVYALVPFRGRKPRRASPEVLVSDSHHPLLESMRQLRANLINSRAGKTHQTVLVSSSRNSEGKTTISCNLARTLARSRSNLVGRVILIDVDMFRPSLHGVFGRPASPGLSDYLNGEATFEQIVQTIELDDGTEMDLVCAGPVPPAPVELTETPRMSELLEHVRQHYTFAVLDAPPYPQVTSSLVLAGKVDRLLSICTLGQTDRSTFTRHVADLARVNRHMGIVINTTERTLSASYGYGYADGGTGGNGEPSGVFARMRQRVFAGRH